MILEIEFNSGVSKYMETLSSLGNFIMVGRCIYLETNKDISIISQSLPISKCQTITTSNYESIPNIFAKSWCSKILGKELLITLEQSEEVQKKLRIINEELDVLEKEVDRIAQEETKQSKSSTNI